MSHTVEIKTQIKDLETLRRAARRLNWPEEPRRGRSFLYDGRITEGLQIRPRGWFFPICATEAGEMLFDTYVPGAWCPERTAHGMTLHRAADITNPNAHYIDNAVLTTDRVAAGAELPRDLLSLIDAYNAEAAIAAAQAEGWIVTEEQTENGGIELTLSR